MSKRILMYTIFSVFGLSLVGANVASAHGWFNASPEEVAQRQETMFQSKAELLGISVDAAKEAWTDGKSIKDLAEANGISEEELRQRAIEKRQEAMRSQIQSLVDQGVISQDQANRRLEFMERQEDEGKGRFGGFGFGFGLRHRF